MSEQDDAVIVTVETPAVEPVPVAVPAAPEYVTPGELAARFELHEQRTQEIVRDALETAWAARDRADEAADAAAVAQVTADAAALVATTVAADADAVDEADELETVKPPTARESKPAAVKVPAQRDGYGAGVIFGR